LDRSLWFAPAAPCCWVCWHAVLCAGLRCWVWRSWVSAVTDPCLPKHYRIGERKRITAGVNADRRSRWRLRTVLLPFSWVLLWFCSGCCRVYLSLLFRGLQVLRCGLPVTIQRLNTGGMPQFPLLVLIGGLILLLTVRSEDILLLAFCCLPGSGDRLTLLCYAPFLLPHVGSILPATFSEHIVRGRLLLTPHWFCRTNWFFRRATPVHPAQTPSYDATACAGRT